jgi:hypothetical protein
MTIEQLKGYDVRVSACSLTAKNEAGKTAGVIRNVVHFKKAVFKDQFNACEKVRKLAKAAGIESNRSYLFAVNLFLSGKDLFVLTTKATEASDFFQSIGVPVITVKSVR